MAHPLSAPPGYELIPLDFAGKLVLCPDGSVYVSVNDVAKQVWQQTKFVASVKSKTRRAYEKGEIYRLPPPFWSMLVRFDRVQERLEQWAHRDARPALKEFDFGEWRRQMFCALLRAAKNKQNEYRAQIDALMERADHWAAREEEYLERIEE